MKLKFKTQAYQTAAVQAVVDCFRGSPGICRGHELHRPG
jgi:type III restriction enzyme